MSTQTLDMKSLQVAGVSASLDRSALPSRTQLSGAVYPSLAAINTTWADFINCRLKENITLPVQLGDCKNVSGVLWVFGAYCRTAAAQYQAVFAHFQQIGLNLASEISAASLVPMTPSTSQQEHIARSPDRAARDSLP